MNGQFFGQRTDTSGIVDRIGNDANSPVTNLDPYIGIAPVDATVLDVEPIGGTVACIAPMYGPLPGAQLMHETPIEEIPVGEGTAVVSKMDAVTIIHDAPANEARPPETPVAANVESLSLVALLNHEDSEHFRTRWNEIQGKFVDEPRSAVQQADTLVSEVVEQITQMFASQHSLLEEQWNLGKEVSTEDLRKTLQHYRSFFNRLVV
jgi:hypothetical protein